MKILSVLLEITPDLATKAFETPFPDGNNVVSVPSKVVTPTFVTHTVEKPTDGFQTVGKNKKKGKSKSTNVGQVSGHSVKQTVRYEPKETTSVPKKRATIMSNTSKSSYMLKNQPSKVTAPSIKEGNIIMSNSYAALDDESDKDVENMYNESANLLHSTHTGGSSSTFTVAVAAGGKLRDKNDEESWALLEDLALYDNESWNDPKDFAKPVKAISLPQYVPSTSDRHVIELENQVKRLMNHHLAPNHPYQTKFERVLSDIDSRQERRLSILGTQLKQQQDAMINKINILWKAISEKFGNTPTHDTAGNSMACVDAISLDHIE
ncbi:hypothetical protein Tco_0565990 [Tanacetum coccineum]